MILINKTKKNYSGTDTSIICLACKPRYKATMYSDIDYAVENCETIENCVSSTRFNGCTQCYTGYAL